jgi:signal transduction histidine kinase
MASSMHMASVQESFRELSEKNRKLQEAYERLKELDRLKSNFLATVSHELRTPLTSIIGYSEMILEGIAGEINEEQREFLSTIHEKGEQLLELIKSLLDLSKLESGTMSLRRADTDCGLLAEQVVSTLTPAARKRGVAIEAKAEEGLPLLFADASRLRQVLNNLTENALKFTPEGGTVTISVSKVMLESEDIGGFGSALLAPAQRPAIQFIVQDTGIGIPAEQRDRVFDAFYQVDNSSTREVGGTGLGLSIVKRLVDAHDGTIQVEANEPSGTAFLVTLPIFKKG